MKKTIAFLFLAFASITLAARTETSTVVRIKTGGATMYKAEASDEGEKLADLGAGDEVTILKQSKARSLIKSSGAIKGWVDNGTLERSRSPAAAPTA
jgi:3-dehydroquinate synthase class II